MNSFNIGEVFYKLIQQKFPLVEFNYINALQTDAFAFFEYNNINYAIKWEVEKYVDFYLIIIRTIYESSTEKYYNVISLNDFNEEIAIGIFNNFMEEIE